MLADWQVKTATQFLRAKLPEQVSIKQVAGVCHLSPSYFIKAFAQTVGLSPYAWLIAQRVEKACGLLGENKLPLAQIALECGFVDQSHLTKAFVKRTGITPARWRQARVQETGEAETRDPETRNSEARSGETLAGEDRALEPQVQEAQAREAQTREAQTEERPRPEDLIRQTGRQSAGYNLRACFARVCECRDEK